MLWRPEGCCEDSKVNRRDTLSTGPGVYSCCCCRQVISRLSPTPSVTEDGTCRCHECAGTCLGLGSGLEPQSSALVLGRQGVLWQVPLRAAMSSHLHSGFHFPCPQPMNWGEQLGPCVLERAPCPCLSVPCTGVPRPRGEEAIAGVAQGVLNVEPWFRMCWCRGVHGSLSTSYPVL